MVTTNNELLNIMNRVGHVTTGYHQKDTFVGGLYEVTAPATRCEVWNMATRIDLYVGKNTPMYSTVNTALLSADIDSYETTSTFILEQTKVKKSKNELCVKFTSVKAFELFMTYYYSAEYKESLKAQTVKTETKKKRQNTRSKKRADAV